ncbi:MAG: DUF4380 domain-containing protein [Anaerolineales bacterium]|nr:DUF4380 domain-containing protein [Anaerolineales bacterium]
MAVPEIGGRIMAYDLAAHPFFFVDPALAGKIFSPEENQGDGTLAAWKNYGGDKTWPAPQGWEQDDQWHGPPDPVLDTGRYIVVTCEYKSHYAQIVMVSPPDPRTGVQITRQFRLERATSRVAVTLRFRNIAERPIRWSIWDVVQLDASLVTAQGVKSFDPSCVVTTPLNPHSRFPQGYKVMFGADDNPQWQVDGGLFRASYQWQIGKVGIDSTAGWIAFCQASQAMAFATRFSVEPGAEYPDDGATVECWTIGAGQVANLDYADSGIYLMETEVLGPLVTLAPGDETVLELEWGCCRCAGPIVDVQEAGCSSQGLALTRSDNEVRLTGSFGVFDAGELILIWRDEAGAEIGRASLGAVDPLHPVVLDRAARASAVHAELSVVATADGASRLLATTVTDAQRLSSSVA